MSTGLDDLHDRVAESEYQPFAAPIGLMLLAAGHLLLPAPIGPAAIVVGSTLCIADFLLELWPTEAERGEDGGE